MGKCIVPGCDSKYWNKPAQGEKRTKLFFARTEDQIQRWNKALANLGIEIKKRSCICELHFEEKYINKYFETVLKDGTVWKMERERPFLRKDAVPTIFRKMGKYMKTERIANNNIRTDSMLKVSDNNIRTDSMLRVSDNNIRTDSMLRVSDGNIRTNSMLQVSDGSIGTDSMLEVSDAPNEVETVEPFSFKVLVDCLHFVQKPSVYWGITVHNCKVLCAKWTHDFTLEKRVIVNKDLSVQVFLRNKKVELQMDEIKSIADLSSFLKQIHLLEVCVNIDDGDSTGCTMFVTQESKTKSFKFCDNCRLKRKKKYDEHKKEKELANALEKARVKNKILAEKFISVNRKFARLKNKVERLKQTVKKKPKSAKSVEQKNWDDAYSKELKELDSIINFNVNECSDDEMMEEEALSNGNEFSTMSYAEE